MSIITRFAPSPTGSLHIGGARTALFNWLYANKNKGLFKLRIEDTDRIRSTNIATLEIINSLNWLGLAPDGKVVYQSKQIHSHQKIAEKLLQEGKAYKCYCSKEELAKMRDKAIKEGIPRRYNGKCRDNSNTNIKRNILPTMRLKTPNLGTTTLNDKILGKVEVENKNIEDFIILRADNSPTYMLSVVVDDHNMNITDVIRGDDHLTNTFKQLQLYNLLNWNLPKFSHLPLIHGTDGTKLSKRHGAESILAYKDLGYLPQAILNYLLRLGWGHENTDIITLKESIKLFSIKGIGKSPAKFDKDKLDNLNSYYIKNSSDKILLELVLNAFEKQNIAINNLEIQRLNKGITSIKQRARSLLEVIDACKFYLNKNEINLNEEANKVIIESKKYLLKNIVNEMQNIQDWSKEEIENVLKNIAESSNLKLRSIASPIRAALTGKTVSPSVFEIMDILGKEESIKRMRNTFHI